jgi:hypothetical protein
VLRHVEGPDQDILDRGEVAKYLRISKEQLDRLIDRCEFPKGVPFGDGKLHVWQWLDCTAFVHLRARLGLPSQAQPKTLAE